MEEKLKEALRWIKDANWIELNWIVLNWIELNWIELNWIELNWIELNWTELNWTELNWTEWNWIELNWIELNWIECYTDVFSVIGLVGQWLQKEPHSFPKSASLFFWARISRSTLLSPEHVTFLLNWCLWVPLWTKLCFPSPNSYVEALIPTVFGDRAFLK